MKTAISVPDDVYERAERLAKREGRTRSDVYTAALREYVSRHDPDEVTEAIDATIDALGEDARIDPFIREAARQVLARTEW